jgi:hypothetical protein
MDRPAPSEPDELMLLQLRVARRADEIARERPIQTSLNLHCWLIAETEMIANENMPKRRTVLRP